MSKHTPGPWIAKQQCGVSGWIDVVSIEPDGSQSLPFAACKHFNEVANSRLIAAAPDLLEALKALTHSIDEGELLHDDQRNAFAASLKAIAKATGEKQ